MSYVTMLDATGLDAANIPGSAAKVAGYVTGSGVVPWDSADWALFPKAGHVRIDQTAELTAWAAGDADVADMEAGAATQATVIAQGLERQAKGWYSFAYVSQANLAALRSAASAAGLTTLQVWLADWDLSEAEAAALLGGDVVAVQWASPSSNPATIVPGGTATLAEANVDISVTVPAWFAYQPATTSGLVVLPDLSTIKVTSADLVTWTAS
jgi:hypothetical protein